MVYLEYCRIDFLWFVQVSWNVLGSEFRSEVEASEGVITFSSGVRETDLVIRLRDDNVSLNLLSSISSLSQSPPVARVH